MGSLHGTLFGDDSLAIGGAILFLIPRGQEPDSSALQAVSSSEGSFRFADVSFGQYRIVVDQASLPTGYHAPPYQDRCVSPANGVYATCAEVAPEDPDPQVTLTVASSSVLILGRVVSDGLEPIANAEIRARGVGTNRGALKYSAISDSEGNFALPVVAGTYDLRVVAPWKSPWADVSRPMPQRLTLSPGERTQVGDLVFGGGQFVITGRVVDQRGEPVPDIDVLVYPAPGTFESTLLRRSTNADGRFMLDRLPEGSVNVQVIPRKYLRETDPCQRLTEHGDPLRVDLGTRGLVVDLDDLLVELRPVYRLLGQVQGMDDKLTFSRGAPRLRLAFSDGTYELLSIEEGTGLFAWCTAVDSLRGSVSLELIRDQGGGEVAVMDCRRIHPRPYVTDRIELLIP